MMTLLLDDGTTRKVEVLRLEAGGIEYMVENVGYTLYIKTRPIRYSLSVATSNDGKEVLICQDEGV